MENDLLNKIIKILDSKKAINIKTIDIKDRSSLADYMIITSGTPSTHIKSLADNVEEDLKKEEIYPNKIEGYNTNSWILMDYGDIIVNIFTEEERENYNLEELWEKINK